MNEETRPRSLAHASGHTRGVLGTAAVIASLAACAPPPEPGPARPPATVLPYAGAPAVPRPLPPSALDGGPCLALTREQRTRALGGDVTTGTPDILPGTGAGCVWHNPNTLVSLSVHFGLESHRGISGLYEKTRPLAVQWKPFSLDGYPAVSYVWGKRATSVQFCAVAVGIADDVTVEIVLRLGGSETGRRAPCDAASDDAREVLATLRTRS